MSDDLIKREDAIEVLAINAPLMSDEAYLKSYDALKSIPSVEPNKGEWIPCSERLPEKQTTVLYSLEGCVSVAFMTDRNYTGETVELHWEDLETGITIYPEAWMPLPEPWKGADDDC